MIGSNDGLSHINVYVISDNQCKQTLTFYFPGDDSATKSTHVIRSLHFRFGCFGHRSITKW